MDEGFLCTITSWMSARCLLCDSFQSAEAVWLDTEDDWTWICCHFRAMTTICQKHDSHLLPGSCCIWWLLFCFSLSVFLHICGFQMLDIFYHTVNIFWSAPVLNSCLYKLNTSSVFSCFCLVKLIILLLFPCHSQHCCSLLIFNSLHFAGYQLLLSYCRLNSTIRQWCFTLKVFSATQSA